jgi:hypothetical protein
MTTPHPQPSTPRVRAATAVCKAPQPAPFTVPSFTKPPNRPRLKARRDAFGGQRGQGNRRRAPIRRVDPESIRIGDNDPSLSAFGGLVAFGRFLQTSGVDAALKNVCAPHKTGKRVVYSMHGQVRLLLDLLAVGGTRIFDLERIAHDPLVCTLAGGALCSLDTLYRDVERFTPDDIDALRPIVAKPCLERVGTLKLKRAHLDIDTSVMPVSGEDIEGAVVGYNPEYRGRPSYHPVLARVAEAGMFLGGVLRPGNTTFGAEEAGLVGGWIDQLRPAIGPSCLLYVRIDKAGHCGAIMKAIEQRGALYLIKGQLGAPLQAALGRLRDQDWTTVDEDADGHPLEQVAELQWTCATWKKLELRPTRVIVVRSALRQGGKQLWLWPELEMTVQVLLTNDTLSAPEDLVSEYDGRAGIEPQFAEGKQEWGLEKVSSKSFDANEALFQLKLLSQNALHAMATPLAPEKAKRWRSSWLRSLLILRPAKVVRSGRATTVRLGAGPALVQRE